MNECYFKSYLQLGHVANVLKSHSKGWRGGGLKQPKEQRIEPEIQYLQLNQHTMATIVKKNNTFKTR